MFDSFSRSQYSIKNSINQRPVTVFIRARYWNQSLETIYLPLYFFKIHFNIILQFTYRPSKYLPFRLCNHSSVHLISPTRATIPARIIIYLIGRTVFCELHNCQLFGAPSTHAFTLTTERFSHCSFYAFTLHSSLSELNRAIILSDPYHLSPPLC